MKAFLILTILVCCLCFTHCSVNRHNKIKNEAVMEVTSGQVIIYTTRHDYAKLVPIILTADKKGVASYPDIKDVYYKGNLSYPTQLHNGFLLDNRGISRDVAFINLTYEQYSTLPVTPSEGELLKMIVDKNPIKKMYACGLRSKFVNITDELNAMIDSDNFTAFNRLK